MKSVHKTIILNALPEVIWAYLTDKDKLGTWFQPAAADLEEGQDYRLHMQSGNGDIWGRVVEAVPYEKLVLTFRHDWISCDTLVTWTLRPVSGGTELTLLHTGFEAAEEGDHAAAEHDKGWQDHLEKLVSELGT